MSENNEDDYQGQPVDDCHCLVLDVFARGVSMFNDTPLRRVILRVRCPLCKKEGQFQGLPHDLPPELASSSADGREVYLPILMIQPEVKP